MSDRSALGSAIKCIRRSAGVMLALVALITFPSVGAAQSGGKNSAGQGAASYDAVLTAANEAMNAANHEEARRLWRRAAAIAPDEATPHMGLGLVARVYGELPQAVEHFGTAVRLHMAARDNAADDAGWLEMATWAYAQLLVVGTELYQAQRDEPAAQAFQALSEAYPNNRDALYNLSLSLYRLERWREVVDVSRELIRLDPLNHNARIMLYNGYRGQAVQMADAANDSIVALARAALGEADRLPIDVGVELDASEQQLEVTVIPRTAPAGLSGTLVFEFFGPAGSVGEVLVPVRVPPPGERARFEARLPEGVILGWSYRLE